MGLAVRPDIMKLAGVTVLDRNVEELAFLLIDSGDLALSFRLTEALENGAHELDLDEQDSIAVLSVLGRPSEGLVGLRCQLLRKRARRRRGTG